MPQSKSLVDADKSVVPARKWKCPHKTCVSSFKTYHQLLKHKETTGHVAYKKRSSDNCKAGVKSKQLKLMASFVKSSFNKKNVSISSATNQTDDDNFEGSSHEENVCAVCQEEEPSNMKKSTNTIDWVCCNICDQWYHNVCVGIEIASGFDVFTCMDHEK